MLPDLATHNPGGKVMLKLPPGVIGGASFHGPGDCYRASLWRVRESETLGRYALWIGTNPSTARGDVDDPTVRCEWYYTTLQLGLSGYLKMNLADYRATDPKALRSAPVPIRSNHNLGMIVAAARKASRVIAAWGAEPMVAGLAPETAQALAAEGIELWCLGTTKSGAPRHPLYVRRTTPLERWSIPT